MLLEENSSRSFLIALKREWGEDYLDIIWKRRDKEQGLEAKSSLAWPLKLLRSHGPDDKVVPLNRGVAGAKEAGKT